MRTIDTPDAIVSLPPSGRGGTTVYNIPAATVDRWHKPGQADVIHLSIGGVRIEVYPHVARAIGRALVSEAGRSHD